MTFFCTVSFTVSAADVDLKPAKADVSKVDTRKEEIKTLQRQLIEYGYYSGPVNGIVTPETRRALQGMLSDR